MITFFRKHSQTLMLFVAIVVTISFVFFYNRCAPAPTSAHVAEIGGQTLTRDDFLRYLRLHALAEDLGLSELTSALATGFTHDPAQNFVFNLITLRRAADKLAIVPSAEELRQTQMELPVFQTESGNFSPLKLAQFIEKSVSPRGFTERQIDDLLTDLIRFRALRRMINATASVAKPAAENSIRRRETLLHISTITFDLDTVRKDLKADEAELKKLFEQDKKNLVSDEKFKLKIATISLSPEQAKLTGRDRILALQALAEKTFELSEAALEKDADFETLAASRGFTLAQTGTFTFDTPDPAIQDIPDAFRSITALSLKSPISEVIQSENKFHLFKLVEHIPSRPLTFEEAKPRLEERLIERLARDKLLKQVAADRTKLEEIMKNGKNFEEATKELGFVAKTLAPFKLAEPPMDDPEIFNILEAAVQMPEGAISQFIPTQNGGLLVCVTKREPPSQEILKARLDEYRSRLQSGLQAAAFTEWLRLQRNELGAKFLATKESATPSPPAPQPG